MISLLTNPREALFFFVTNIMIVFGLVAIDQVVAVAEYQAATAPGIPEKHQSPARLLILSCSDWQREADLRFLHGLAQAVDLVSEKSQSMYMGSAMFQGALRIDLLLLYASVPYQNAPSNC